uniref:Interferon regulatory factor 5 n=1 Tax=Eptatretus burgeri TaxID=7764 RepID=A0A8C4WX71_EPTBU
MSGSKHKPRLGPWLIEQVNNGQYEGLHWLDVNKMQFQMPWNQTSRQDRSTGRCIFQAWAIATHKFQEGRDVPNPPKWKTNLRCALNKSQDFQMVKDCSKDSPPFKIYEIKRSNAGGQCRSTWAIVLIQLMQIIMALSFIFLIHPNTLGTNLTASNPTGSELEITVEYRGRRMLHTVLPREQDGCRLYTGSLLPHNSIHSGILGPQSYLQIQLPPVDDIESIRQKRLTMHLLEHSERGLLLRSGDEGIFAKRLCQCKVYWSGLGTGPGLASETKPQVLCRETEICLFEYQFFFQELINFLEGRSLVLPEYRILLCFGEEWPDPNKPKHRKLIMVQASRRPLLYHHNTVPMSLEFWPCELIKLQGGLKVTLPLPSTFPSWPPKPVADWASSLMQSPSLAHLSS